MRYAQRRASRPAQDLEAPSSMHRLFTALFLHFLGEKRLRSKHKIAPAIHLLVLFYGFLGIKKIG